MTTVTLDIAPDVYQALQYEANKEGKPVELVAHNWLGAYLRERQAPTPDSMSDRDRFIALLRSNGLLAEPTPEEKERAKACTVSLDEVQRAFARAGGTPLSEIVIEQRCPKL